MTWDLTSYFREFNCPEMLQFKEAIRLDITALQLTTAGLPTLTAPSANGWEDILLRNDVLASPGSVAICATRYIRKKKPNSPAPVPNSPSCASNCCEPSRAPMIRLSLNFAPGQRSRERRTT